MTGKRSGSGSGGFSGGGLGGMAYLPEFDVSSITQNTSRWPRAPFWQGPILCLLLRQCGEYHEAPALLPLPLATVFQGRCNVGQTGIRSETL